MAFFVHKVLSLNHLTTKKTHQTESFSFLFISNHIILYLCIRNLSLSKNATEFEPFVSLNFMSYEKTITYPPFVLHRT